MENAVALVRPVAPLLIVGTRARQNSRVLTGQGVSAASVSSLHVVATHPRVLGWAEDAAASWVTWRRLGLVALHTAFTVTQSEWGM